jgi:hypothetical protein
VASTSGSRVIETGFVTSGQIGSRAKVGKEIAEARGPFAENEPIYTRVSPAFIFESGRLPDDVLKGGEYDVSVEVPRPYALREMLEPPS